MRNTLRRIRDHERLAGLCLFRRHQPERMLAYLEHRACRRESIRMPVYVTPVTFDGRYARPAAAAGGPSMIAVTRDLSLRGIGFTHDEPLDGDYAVVTFDLLDDEAVSVLLEVRWSNRRKARAYTSGGRFLALSETPAF